MEDHEHSHDNHEHHQASELRNQLGEITGDLTFELDSVRYRVSAEAARSSGMKETNGRIQLPDGRLVLLHPHEGMTEPHPHEDHANSAKDIQAKGGKVWPAEKE